MPAMQSTLAVTDWNLIAHGLGFARFRSGPPAPPAGSGRSASSQSQLTAHLLPGDYGVGPIHAAFHFNEEEVAVGIDQFDV